MAYTVTRSAKGIVDQINDLWADPIFQGNDWQERMESWEPKRERLIAEILDYIVDGSLRGEDMMVVLTTLRTLYEEDR